MLVHLLWNKRYDKVSNTHRYTPWWWNSSARGTDEEPLSYNHRRSYKICSLVLHIARCVLAPNRDLLAFGSLTGRSHYLGTFSHFQLKRSCYWEFLTISAYAGLPFLLFSCLSCHVYLLVILIYVVCFTVTFFHSYASSVTNDIHKL